MLENSADVTKHVSAKEYAKQQGDTEENIVWQLRKGHLIGEIKDDVWFVDIESSNNLIAERSSRKSKPGMNMIISILLIVAAIYSTGHAVDVSNEPVASLGYGGSIYNKEDARPLLYQLDSYGSAAGKRFAWDLRQDLNNKEDWVIFWGIFSAALWLMGIIGFMISLRSYRAGRQTQDEPSPV